MDKILNEAQDESTDLEVKGGRINLFRSQENRATKHVLQFTEDANGEYKDYILQTIKEETTYKFGSSEEEHFNETGELVLRPE